MNHDEHEIDDRLPPQSIDAEMCLLGSMMLDRDVALECLTILDTDSFYLTDHAIIFDAIKGLLLAKKPIDAIVLKDELKRGDLLGRVGGTAYISQILATVPSAAHAVEYATRVKEKALRRSLINLADKATRRAYSGDEDAGQLIAEVQQSLTQLVSSAASEQVMTLGDIVAQTVNDLRNPGARDFVSYGFKSIDAKLMGIDSGEFVVVGARPSMGKSTLLRQMAVLSATDGVPTLYVSLEENPLKVGRNVMAWMSMTENQRIRRGDVRGHELGIIEDAAAKMRDVPFWFVWGTNKAEALRSLIMSYVTRFKIKTVFLDYLQLVDAGGKTDFEKATNSSRFCASLPKTINTRLVAAAQLSRAVAGREDHRPTMTDLRSTGQIEQDADVIMLLHREDYYHTEDANYTNTDEAEVIIAKARDSERNVSISLRSQLAYQCFSDLEPTSGAQMKLNHSPEDFMR